MQVGMIVGKRWGWRKRRGKHSNLCPNYTLGPSLVSMKSQREAERLCLSGRLPAAKGPEPYNLGLSPGSAVDIAQPPFPCLQCKMEMVISTS